MKNSNHNSDSVNQNFTTSEFPHVIQCTQENINAVWYEIRKQIMEIDPDLIFRSRKSNSVKGSRNLDSANSASYAA